jgi:hypothetical protein
VSQRTAALVLLVGLVLTLAVFLVTRSNALVAAMGVALLLIMLLLQERQRPRR